MMKKLIWFAIPLLLAMASSGAEVLAFDVEAGPIWNQRDAESKCPRTCQGVSAAWNGQWTTTIPGTMSVCGCESSVDPFCDAETVALAKPGDDPGDTARNYCQVEGKGWFSFEPTSATSLEVTCCRRLTTEDSGVPNNIIDLSDSAQADPNLWRQLDDATSTQQLIQIAKSRGLEVTAQDIALALQSGGYQKQSKKRSVKTLSAASCGGLQKPPCSVCTNSVTVYWPFNFCCIPEYTTCEAYQSRCDGGYRNRVGQCLPTAWKPRSLGQWAIDFDQRWKLPMDWRALNSVTELRPGMNQSITDGLYIFVYRTTDNKLLIRRSDRPDDRGLHSHGEKIYSLTGNPAGNGESPHMFVRHTQLNGGWSDVWSAGQLEYYHGQLLWISNASGHYAPSLTSLDYVLDTLVVWHLISNKAAVAKHPHDWKPPLQ